MPRRQLVMVHVVTDHSRDRFARNVFQVESYLRSYTLHHFGLERNIFMNTHGDSATGRPFVGVKRFYSPDIYDVFRRIAATFYRAVVRELRIRRIL